MAILASEFSELWMFAGALAFVMMLPFLLIYTSTIVRLRGMQPWTWAINIGVVLYGISMSLAMPAMDRVSGLWGAITIWWIWLPSAGVAILVWLDTRSCRIAINPLIGAATATGIWMIALTADEFGTFVTAFIAAGVWHVNVALGLKKAAALVFNRPLPTEQCSCGYSLAGLAGLAGNICPECGSAIAANKA